MHLQGNIPQCPKLMKIAIWWLPHELLQARDHRLLKAVLWAAVYVVALAEILYLNDNIVRGHPQTLCVFSGTTKSQQMQSQAPWKERCLARTSLAGCQKPAPCGSL